MIDADHHARRLDDRVHILALGQAESCCRLLGDDRDDLDPARQFDRNLRVDRPLLDLLDLTLQGIPRAELPR